MSSYFEERQIKLANDLLNYKCDSDIHEVFDNYDSTNQALDSIIYDLQNEKSLKGILKSLKEDIINYSYYLEEDPKDKESKKLFDEAQCVYKDLKSYKKELKDLEKGRVI